MAEALGVERAQRLCRACSRSARCSAPSAGALVVPTAAASLDMADRVRGRGLRRRRDRRARLDARRARRRVDRRPDPRAVDRVLSRVRDAGDLSDRHRRAAVPARPACSESRWHEARSTLRSGRRRRRRRRWRAAAARAAAVLRRPDDPVLRLRHRLARLQSAVRLQRACCRSAMRCFWRSAPMARR